MSKLLFGWMKTAKWRNRRRHAKPVKAPNWTSSRIRILQKRKGMIVRTERRRTAKSRTLRRWWSLWMRRTTSLCCPKAVTAQCLLKISVWFWWEGILSEWCGGLWKWCHSPVPVVIIRSVSCEEEYSWYLKNLTALWWLLLQRMLIVWSRPAHFLVISLCMTSFIDYLGGNV